jgi:hypothetical protein
VQLLTGIDFYDSDKCMLLKGCSKDRGCRSTGSVKSWACRDHMINGVCNKTTRSMPTNNENHSLDSCIP